jgi:hypothetical protein
MAMCVMRGIEIDQSLMHACMDAHKNDKGRMAFS